LIFCRISALFSRTGVRYEVALDVLGAMIAHYAEAIARERDRLDADEIVIAFLGTIRPDSATGKPISVRATPS
jgi:hypothetical protein